MVKDSVSRDFLEEISDKFYIETSRRECFEITKAENGYILKDITPPVFELNIKSYSTVLISKDKHKKLEMNGTLTGEMNFYQGIIKGRPFSFTKENDENLITTGNIEKCYIRKEFGSYTFVISLFNEPGRKVSFHELFQKGFTLITSTGEHVFSKAADKLYFECLEVLAIYSLFKFEGKLKDIGDISTFNVSHFNLYYNKPFIVLLKERDDKIRFSLINENVISINVK